MLMDKLLDFSDDQDVTAAAASTNVIDLKAARDLGAGGEKQLYIVVQVFEALVDDSSNSTVAVKLQTDADEAFGSAVDLVDPICTIAAVAAAGTRYIYAIPPGLAFERYIRLYYTPANGNLTSSGIKAWLTDNIEQLKNYPAV